MPFRSSGSAWDALSIPENSLRTGTTVRRQMGLTKGRVGAHACKKNNDRGGKKVLYVTIDGSVRLASDFTLCGMH